MSPDRVTENMKPTIDIYTGSPIEIESERSFLADLREALLARGESALIFANFFPEPSPSQVDFLVIARSCACHVELKNFSASVQGGVNGSWKLRQPHGGPEHLEAKNPYRQALACKYAISDVMHRLAKKGIVPNLPRGDKFYKHIESVVCIYPRLLPGSHVPSDHLVRTLGYPELIEFLVTQKRAPAWTQDHWLEVAMNLGLAHEENPNEAIEPDLVAARDAVAHYRQRFIEACRSDLHELVGTSVTTGECCTKSNEILDLLQRGVHAQLVGPSGFGKTHFVRHAAMKMAAAGGIPLIVAAGRYDGRLSILLDRSVACFHPNTAMHLLDSATKANCPVAIIIDGFNTCPSKIQARLLEDLQAFYLRRPVPILFTSQQEIVLTECLTGVSIRFAPLFVGREAGGDCLVPRSHRTDGQGRTV